MPKELINDQADAAEFDSRLLIDTCPQKETGTDGQDVLSDQKLEAEYENDKMLHKLFSIDRQLRLRHQQAKVALAAASKKENKLQEPLLSSDIKKELAKNDYLDCLSDSMLADDLEAPTPSIVLQYDQDLQNAHIKGSDAEELSGRYPDYIKARKRLRQADNYSTVWHDMSQILRQHSEHLHQVEIATWGDLEHFQITICSYDSWEERQSKIATWDFVDEAFQVFQDAKDALWSFCISQNHTETAASNVIIQYWSALLDYKRFFHDAIYLQLPSDQEMDPVNIQYRDELLARFNSALAKK